MHDDLLYRRLAEKLDSIGWRSHCDAQWTRLRDALPELRAMLLPAETAALRDHFAGLAMQASVGAVNVKDSPEAYARITDHAYRMADAMLKAREVRHG